MERHDPRRRETNLLVSAPPADPQIRWSEPRFDGPARRPGAWLLIVERSLDARGSELSPVPGDLPWSYCTTLRPSRRHRLLADPAPRRLGGGDRHEPELPPVHRIRQRGRLPRFGRPSAPFLRASPAAHIRQIVRVQVALGRPGTLGMTLENLLDATGLGVVQLDGRGRIVAANDRARSLLRTGDVLFDTGGSLFARTPQANDELQDLLTQPCRRSEPGERPVR